MTQQQDPVQEIQAAIDRIKRHLGGTHGWSAKPNPAGVWVITAPGGRLRLLDSTNPDLAAEALDKLGKLGLDQALSRVGVKPTSARAKSKKREAPVSKSVAKSALMPAFESPVGKPPGPAQTPPAYPGDPSPDEGPVRRKLLLTPAMARELLDRPWEATTSDGIKLRQRELDKETVRYFVDLIHRDRFQLTYQGCGIGVNGSYYDGQHRAHAVISSGRSVWVWMNYNMHPDEIDGLDGGRQRRTSTRLSMEGFDHPLLLGAAAKLLYNVREWESMPEQAPPWHRWYITQVTDTVRREIVHGEPQLYESVQWTAALKQPRGFTLNPTAIAVFHYLVARDWAEGGDARDAFLVAAATAVGVSDPDHAAMQVRDWLARWPSKPLVKKHCLVEAHLVLLISAWNRHIKGLPPKKIPGALWPQFPTLHTP